MLSSEYDELEGGHGSELNFNIFNDLTSIFLEFKIKVKMLYDARVITIIKKINLPFNGCLLPQYKYFVYFISRFLFIKLFQIFLYVTS
jgi:hypothetical protein